LFITVYYSGSDGLLKLWDIKTSTCVKSIDAHEGKIWGMSASTDENLLVTCASDSSVTIWRVGFISFETDSLSKLKTMKMFILGFN
jgi:U3 small nucleolar RNA-associated protein 13